MASITTWTRLETRQRTDDLDVSLAARVHDPLWLLARQWQLGELRGHDAGVVGPHQPARVGRLAGAVVPPKRHRRPLPELEDGERIEAVPYRQRR